MNEDLLPILGIVLLGGFAVWFLMRKKTTPVAAPTPCTVGGTYGGAGLAVSCSELEKGIKGVTDLVKHVVDIPSKVFSMVPGIGGGGAGASLGDQIERANAKGYVFQTGTGGWKGNDPNAQKLPPGAINTIVNGKPVLQYPPWKGDAPAPGAGAIPPPRTRTTGTPAPTGTGWRT